LANKVILKNKKAKKFKPPEEWFRQADYDLDTAKVMFQSGRYIYTVFMCHLSVEKALKSLYAKRFKEDPPKTHDLSYLTERIGLVLPGNHHDFLEDLNDLSIPTRYPDDLKKLLKQFQKTKVRLFLNQTVGLLKWLEEKI
jgi:HEPN domain-containing protein